MRLSSTIAVLMSCALFGIGCAKERTMTFPMVWSGGTEWEQVYLDFKEWPNHYVDIRSSDLRDYLETLGTNEVVVVFNVTTRLGCVERLETDRIGSRADWPHVWAGTGWVDHEHPSPWDDLNCPIPWL